MSLTLTTVQDGVTAVNAASVNQYKTALETVAGAGWDDSAGDLTVKELSDAVKTPGDGLNYTGTGNLEVDLATGSGLDFDSGNLRIAAAAAGDGIKGGAGSALAVDVSDFAGTGLEDDGSENLRIAAAAAGDGLQGGAGSALAVDVSDFAGTGLEDDGSENLRIAAAAAGAGLTGGGGSALAVQVDNSTIEVPVDTLQVKDAGITVAKLAAAALSGKGNTAGRPAAAKEGYLYWNTQTVALERDTGVAFEELTGIISAANVTDLTDGGYTTLHKHVTADTVIYTDVAVSTGSGAAPDFTVYEYADPGSGSALSDKVRFVYNHHGDVTTLSFTVQARVSADPSPANPYVVIAVLNTGGVEQANNDAEIDQYGASFKDFTVDLDVSSLAAGLYTVELSLAWTSATPSGETSYMKTAVVKAK